MVLVFQQYFKADVIKSFLKFVKLIWTFSWRWRSFEIQKTQNNKLTDVQTYWLKVKKIRLFFIKGILNFHICIINIIMVIIIIKNNMICLLIKPNGYNASSTTISHSYLFRRSDSGQREWGWLMDILGDVDTVCLLYYN